MECPTCNGIGKWETTDGGYHILDICPECNGNGEASITITRKEYDSLLEYKSMYEGLCK